MLSRLEDNMTQTLAYLVLCLPLGDHFRVVAHPENDALAAEALEIAEATWPVMRELLGVPVDAEHEPLELHLYADPEEYHAVDDELTGGDFEKNLAFAHFDSKTAHVVLQPYLSGEALEETGLPYQTARLIAHEAAHLVRYASLDNYRHHPNWVANGTASWVEAHVMEAQGRVIDIENDPHFSTQILHVQRRLEEGGLPSLRDLLVDEQLPDGFYEAYAYQHLAFRYLTEKKQRKKLDKILGGLDLLGGGSARREEFAEHVEKTIGKKRWKDLNRGFEKYVEDLAPAWDEVFVALETAGDDWLQAAFPDKNAIAWRTEAIDEDRWEITGELRVLPGDEQQLNLLLDRSEAGFVQVSFIGGRGVSLFEFDAQKGLDGTWDERVFERTELMRADEFVHFRVAWKRDEISVDLAGEQIFELELDRTMDGAWGLGALRSSAGIWRSVTLDR